MTILRGKNYIIFLSVIIGTIGAAIYPIVISPMLNPEEYKRIQKINRAGVKQEEIQPGNMKVWSNPFERK